MSFIVLLVAVFTLVWGYRPLARWLARYMPRLVAEVLTLLLVGGWLWLALEVLSWLASR